MTVTVAPGGEDVSKEGGGASSGCGCCCSLLACLNALLTHFCSNSTSVHNFQGEYDDSYRHKNPAGDATVSLSLDIFDEKAIITRLLEVADHDQNN